MSWFYYPDLLELKTDFHAKRSIPGPKQGCLGPLHALKYPRYVLGVGRYDKGLYADWRGQGKQFKMGLVPLFRSFSPEQPHLAGGSQLPNSAQ